MGKLVRIVVGGFFIFCALQTKAQIAIDLRLRDLQRTQQLTDTAAPNISYNIQASVVDKTEGLVLVKKNKINFKLSLLPVGISVQNNSDHPYGNNDGSMIPAAGAQTQISGGILLKAGRFALRVQPELVYAANPDFEGFPAFHYNFLWNRYYKYLNQSDLPEQYGVGAFQKVFAGQSSFTYSNQNWAAGISTENIWWGPGRRNSLILSYNAPGFLHGTFHSVKPLATRIGSFEWQVVFGQLNNSGILPPDTSRVFEGNFIYQPKIDEKRYITCAVINWQPKWVKGLFLGATTASYLYMNDLKRVADILPLDGFVQTNTDKIGHKASLGSIFARFAMPKENAEFYIEYGRSNKTPSIWNNSADSHIPKGYLFGLRKLFPLKQRGQFIQFATEFTQLQLSDGQLLMDANSSSWYTHPYVRQGFTNEGQSLGAGIGPGSNSESIEVSWLMGFNKIGLVFERVVRNNDFYYYAYTPSGDFNRHWIDLSTELQGQWQFKKIILAADLGLIRSLNYEWFSMPSDQSSGSYFKGGWDVLNFHGQFSVRYRL